nr:mechanosensitive ion channel family protein [Candidatus Omnitrophota bacterium]
MNLEIMDRVFLGNSISDYAVALLMLAILILFVKIIVRYFVGRLKKIAKKTATTFDDFLIKVLEKIGLPVLYISCFYVSAKTLKLPSAAGSL